MKNIVIMLILTFILLGVSSVSAQEHQLAGGKQLIDAGVSCDKLTDGQLEAVGEYYMEQMHPGDAHGLMDKMMGGEGSARLKQMHIQMAKRLYCTEGAEGASEMMDKSMMGSGGMMSMMAGMAGLGLVGASLAGSGSAMMGGPLTFTGTVMMLFWSALIVALILSIIWLYKKVTGPTMDSDSPLEILKKRFARGEITKKEYESMKNEVK